MRRLILFPVAFVAGWAIGAVVMVSVASWRMLRDMDRPSISFGGTDTKAAAGSHKPGDILQFVETS